MKEQENTVTDNPNTPTGELTSGEIQAAERLSQAYQTIRSEMSKAIVGQAQVLEELSALELTGQIARIAGGYIRC